MKKITAFILLVSSLVAGAASLTLLTAEIQLPGGGTNKLSFSYPGAASVVAPMRAFAPDTNGTISVTYNTASLTNYPVAGFAPGHTTLDMGGFPPLRFGQDYTFTSSETNAVTVLVTYEISAP